MKKRKLTFLFGTGISLFFLYLALRKVSITRTREVLTQANYVWLIPTTISYLLSLMSRGVRWRYLLLPIKKCKVTGLISTLIIGFMGNSLLPMRAGELIRAYINGIKERISKSSSLATIVVERVFDGLALVVILLLAFIFLSAGSHVEYKEWQWLTKMIYIAMVLFWGALAFLYAVIFSRKLTLNLLGRVSRFIKGRTRARILTLIDSFITGLNILREARGIIKVSFLSFLVWALEGAAFYFAAKALRLPITYPQGCLLTVIVALGVMVPSSPGFIGVYEYFCILALSLFSVEKTLALTYAVLVHSIQFVLIVGLGLFFIWKENLSWGALRQEITSPAS